MARNALYSVRHRGNPALIVSFADKESAEVWHGKPSKKFPRDLLRPMRRKLAMLDAAVEIKDLASPPGNRLEKLSGDRAGKHSIRINDRWRICFIWTGTDASHVEIVDYH